MVLNVTILEQLFKNFSSGIVFELLIVRNYSMVRFKNKIVI